MKHFCLLFEYFVFIVHYLTDNTLKLRIKNIKKISHFGYSDLVLYCKLKISLWMHITGMLFYFFNYVLFIINVSEFILNNCSELLTFWRRVCAFSFFDVTNLYSSYVLIIFFLLFVFLFVCISSIPQINIPEILIIFLYNYV